MLLPFGFIGSEFITQSDRGEFAVILEMPAGSSIENTNYVTQKVEKYVNSLPEVKNTFVTVGASNEGLLGQSSNNASEIDVALITKDMRNRSTDDIGDMIKLEAMKIPGVKARVNPIGIFGTANQTPIQLIVSGPNREKVKEGADILVSTLKKIPGTADVRLSSEDGKPETRIDIDRAKMA